MAALRSFWPRARAAVRARLRPARERLQRAWRECADALWPARCLLCGAAADDGVACQTHALPQPGAGLDGARCARCAGALPRGVPPGRRCAACARHAPGWSRLVALWDYRERPALRDWILAFKHGRRAQLARPLGWALARALARQDGDARALARPDGDAGALLLLVPVPLHPRRRFERGYDQAERLARELALHLGAQRAQVLCALQRARPTSVQGAPGAVSRAANVRAAFDVAPRWRAPRARRALAALLARGEVHLVDDVVTSGATVRECARALRALGARRVHVVALARAAGTPRQRAASADWPQA